MQYHIAGTLRIEAVPSPDLMHMPGCKAHQHCQTLSLQSTGQLPAVITAAIARDPANISSTTPAATTTTTAPSSRRPAPVRRATEPARPHDTDEAYKQRTSADSLPAMSTLRQFEPSSCIHLMTRPSTERSDPGRIRPGPPAHEQRRGAWLPGAAVAAVTASPKTSHMPRTIPALAHRRKRKASQPWYERITENQALWFLTLPPKVRKQQFSKEEQTLLTQKCEDVLQRASSGRANSSSPHRNEVSPGKMKKAGLAKHSPVPDSTSSTHDSSDQDIPTTRSLDLPASETLSLTLHNRRRASIGGPVTDIKKVGARTQTPATTPTPYKPMGLPRAMALKPLPLPAPTLAPLEHATTASANLPPASPTDPLRPLSALSTPSQPPEASRGTSYFSARSTREALPLSVDYSDNRMQFSDPLTQTMVLPTDVSGLPIAELAGDTPSVNNWLASPTDKGSFLPRCRPSSLDSDQNSLDTEGPTTPSQLDDSRLPPYKSGSVDSGVGLPHQLNPSNSQGGVLDPLGLTGDHEVTLCVRLSPAGFAKPGQEMVGGQSRMITDTEYEDDDPLALGALPVCDDDTGAHGAFAVHDDRSPKGLKRVWSSLRRH